MHIHHNREMSQSTLGLAHQLTQFLGNRNYGLRGLLSFHFLLFIFLTLTALLIVFTTDAYAQPSTPHILPNDVTQGTFLFRSSTENSYTPAPTLETKAHMIVTGFIARTTVRQKFRNPGSDWAEGIYVFPLPETAAVDHLRMHIGERVIEGHIQERTEAKKVYTAAKQEGKHTSLIEQERPNMFTASIANIGPNETMTVEIEYQETVHYDSGKFSLRFPMVVGPRYIPGTPTPPRESVTHTEGHGWAKNTNQVPDASRITPPVQHPEHGPLNRTTLTIDLAPGFPLASLASTYHNIHQTSNSQSRYQIALQDGDVPADRDFELTWEPKQEQIPHIAVFSEQHHGDTYLMLIVIPPPRTFADHLTLPRDVTFVIDTSGSMHGTSIHQATFALHLALTRLKDQDRFNVIRFNHETQALFSASQPVTNATIQQATQYVSQLKADGGTEILPALQLALAHQKPVQQEIGKHVRQVIFITDGQIGNEQELFQAIQQYLAHTRLFTIGIGSAPNSYFMRNAAQFGRGTFTNIGHLAEVQDKMNQLFHKLEHPVITDIDIALTGETLAEILPERAPDLYAGEPLLLAIRTTTPSEHIRLTGTAGSKNWETTVSLDEALQRRGIATYWARQKISTLMDQDVERKKNSRLRQEIIDIAMVHHLVSRYTSLVAVDVTPARLSGQTLFPHAIKTNLPHGQEYTAIFGLSAGATNGTWHLLTGLILLLIAGACTAYQWIRV
ncbi:MAG: marine proteobacterial sortase target protein [Nitrospirales bacterium]|nr:MAG: marine proteobacterial sortase target protein [Nitrospirales bacterium]